MGRVAMMQKGEEQLRDIEKREDADPATDDRKMLESFSIDVFANGYPRSSLSELRPLLRERSNPRRGAEVGYKMTS